MIKGGEGKRKTLHHRHPSATGRTAVALEKEERENPGSKREGLFGEGGFYCAIDKKIEKRKSRRKENSPKQ